MAMLTTMETPMAKLQRYSAIFQLSPKATKVENMTIGFIIGPLNIKAMAAWRGTFFCTSRRVMGTMPHSQPGNNDPIQEPRAAEAKRLAGIILAIISSVTNI